MLYLCQLLSIKKRMQTIDTYKLTSMEEPSDEILAQIMHEAALDAKRKGEEAHKRYFDQLREMAGKAIRELVPSNTGTAVAQ